VNNCFFDTNNYLLDNVDRIRHIPGVIVHGRYDIVCPFMSAWDLHRAWPEAKLQVIPNAGHAATEPGITDALIRATDNFR
jgi:proline iminopeptidase